MTISNTADAADADVDIADLSLFKLEILYTLADGGPEYGLAIKRALEERYDQEVNHGRLYPNLDDLVQRGLLEKSKRDDRTNEYELSPAGRLFVRDHARQRMDVVDTMDERVNGGSA